MSASRFPPPQSKPSEKRCPNCSSRMAAYSLLGHYESTVEIDVCMECNAIWFDQLESSMLSPDGTVALFQLIHERGGASTDAARKFSEGLRCATCRESMKLTNDQVRGTRFTYQACRHGHGRLTTFYNFLAEKQFVRELTRTERTKLAATVKQIRCSGCGAPVDIGKVDACAYCRAPVSVFDREAAKKAIDDYLQERQKQPAPVSGNRREAPRSEERWSTYDRVDLGSDILYALGRLAARGLGGAGRTAPLVGGAVGGVAGSAIGGTLETFPDATSALFGDTPSVAASTTSSVAGTLPDVLPSASDALFGSMSASASNMTVGAAGALADALPSAPDALFGSALGAVGDAGASLGGEIASVLSEAASSSLGESVADAASSLAGGPLESVAEGGASLASDVASSAGEGIIDLVTEGIGSLLGSLFN